MSTSVTTGTDTSDINHLKQGIYAHGPFERRAFLPIIGPEVDGFFLSQSVFGQSKTFSDDTRFVDLEDFNPVTYINSSGSNLYPSIVKNVDIRTPAQSDGTIEALTIRKSIARTSQSTFLTEHSVKGHVQEGNEDVNGRTDAITQFYEPGLVTEYEARDSIDSIYRNLVRSNDALHHWPLDDLSTTAIPIVGSVNLVGGPLHEPTTQVAGLTGQAFSFNGTSDYITSDADIILTTYSRVVFEALIYVQQHDGAQRTCWELSDLPNMFAGVGTLRFDLDGFDGGGSEAALTNGDVGVNSGYGDRITEGQWTHVAVVYDYSLPGSGETEIYHDGILQSRTAFDSSNNTGLFGSYPLTLGSRKNIGQYAKFKIQHLAIYGGSGFTPAKILQHANLAHSMLPPRKIKSFNPYYDGGTYITAISGYAGGTVASTITTTVAYTGTTASYVIPENTGQIDFYVWGAGGGTGRWPTYWGGGAGGFVSGTITNLTAGQTLYMIVGGSGSSLTGTSGDFGGLGGYGGGGYGTMGDSSGGGGGGYSGIFFNSITQSNAIVIAGGGGGGTGWAAGGGGGGATGGAGFGNGESGAGGLGGTQIAGGADSSGAGGESAGRPLQGGHPSGFIDVSSFEDGGGGGGGYFGGGAGGVDAKAGGGGSDYVNATYVTTYSMFQGQHGAASDYAYPSGSALISYYGLTGSTGLGAIWDGSDPNGYGGNGAIVIVTSILSPLTPIYDYSNALRIDSQGTATSDVHITQPFDDTSDDSFDMLDVTLTGDDVKNALNEMSPDADNFIPQNHRSTGAGFTYDNNPIGTDSIAYGGLKR